jgi:hypothetical protein
MDDPQRLIWLDPCLGACTCALRQACREQGEHLVRGHPMHGKYTHVQTWRWVRETVLSRPAGRRRGRSEQQGALRRCTHIQQSLQQRIGN